MEQEVKHRVYKRYIMPTDSGQKFKNILIESFDTKEEAERFLRLQPDYMEYVTWWIEEYSLGNSFRRSNYYIVTE